MKKYYYIYEIINKTTGMRYVGKRTSTTTPELDLGIKYFSSSTNKQFIKHQKENPTSYYYYVLSTHDTVKEATQEEIRLHNIFNVGRNHMFFNKAIQTSTKFDTTGIPLSPEHKIKLSERHKGKPGTTNGRRHTNDTKQKMSSSQKGRKHSEETKKKMKESHKNISLETRQKMSIIRLNKIWIHDMDNTEEKLIHRSDCIPDNWIKGRKKRQ